MLSQNRSHYRWFKNEATSAITYRLLDLCDFGMGAVAVLDWAWWYFQKKANPLTVIPKNIVMFYLDFWFTDGYPSVDYKPFGLAFIKILSKLHI